MPAAPDARASFSAQLRFAGPVGLLAEGRNLLHSLLGAASAESTPPESDVTGREAA